MNIDKMMEKKKALVAKLVPALVGIGFRSTLPRGIPRGPADGFEMKYRCTSPSGSLEVATHVCNMLESMGFRDGVADTDDQSIQYIKGQFYATIGAGRFGVTVFFEEKP